MSDSLWSIILEDGLASSFCCSVLVTEVSGDGGGCFGIGACKLRVTRLPDRSISVTIKSSGLVNKGKKQLIRQCNELIW